jgi:hypothetical protein
MYAATYQGHLRFENVLCDNFDSQNEIFWKGRAEKCSSLGIFYHL